MSEHTGGCTWPTAERTPVDFWFDPLCPWAWITSRWMLEVEKVRPVEVALARDEPGRAQRGPGPPGGVPRSMDEAWGPVRVCIAAAAEARPGGARPALHRARHPLPQPEAPRTRETIEAALRGGRPDRALADAADSDEYDEALRASHTRGHRPGRPGGRHAGHRRSDGRRRFFGPVVTPAPARRGGRAGCGTAYALVAGHRGFFEIKRTRTRGADLRLTEPRRPGRAPEGRYPCARRGEGLWTRCHAAPRSARRRRAARRSSAARSGRTSTPPARTGPHGQQARR